MVEAVAALLGIKRKEGFGVLLVEQNLYSTLAVADRVCIFETGRRVWEGSPAELTARQSLLERYPGIHASGSGLVSARAARPVRCR